MDADDEIPGAFVNLPTSQLIVEGGRGNRPCRQTGCENYGGNEGTNLERLHGISFSVVGSQSRGNDFSKLSFATVAVAAVLPIRPTAP